MSILKELLDNNTDITDRILENPTFVTNAESGFSLDDIVIVYNDGQNWKIVPLQTIMQYPVIHDIYYEEINNGKNNGHFKESNVVNISIIVCPYTLYSVVLFGTYVPINKIFFSNIIIKNKINDNNIYVPILNNLYSMNTGELIEKNIRKDEVRIMTVRNILAKYPDCLFIDTKKIDTNKSKIVDESYYNGRDILYPVLNYNDVYHPKTLIYIIEYMSKKTGKYKYTVIVPKGVEKDRVNPNNYNIKKNGFDNYIFQLFDKIREKNGMVYNCLWFAWNSAHPDSKILKL